MSFGPPRRQGTYMDNRDAGISQIAGRWLYGRPGPHPVICHRIIAACLMTQVKHLELLKHCGTQHAGDITLMAFTRLGWYHAHPLRCPRRSQSQRLRQLLHHLLVYLAAPLPGHANILSGQSPGLPAAFRSANGGSTHPRPALNTER